MIEDVLALCITLDPTNEERAVRAKREIAKLGFRKFAFVPGVNGKNIPDEDLRSMLSSRAYYELKNGRYVHEAMSGPGAVGCFLAHYQCWSRGTEETVAIFEDDFVSTPNAKEDLERAYQDALSRGFDILRLAYRKNSDMKMEIEKVSDNLNRVKRSECAAAYIVTPEAASVLLEKAFPLTLQCDHYLDMISDNETLNQYFVKHSFFSDPKVKSLLDHSKLEMYTDGFSRNTIRRHKSCVFIVVLVIIAALIYYMVVQRRKRRF
jgi:GR25 family glycosyltransferase involved in LPS biosynthesis